MACPRDCGDRGCYAPGVGHLVPCQSRRNSTRGDGSSRPPRGGGCFAETNCAGRRNHPAWKRATIHYFTHLFPYEWLPKEVVFRYWVACQAGATPCCHRNTGSRSATPTSSQQLIDRADKSQTRCHYQNPVSGTSEEQRCIPTGRR